MPVGGPGHRSPTAAARLCSPAREPLLVISDSLPRSVKIYNPPSVLKHFLKILSRVPHWRLLLGRWMDMTGWGKSRRDWNHTSFCYSPLLSAKNTPNVILYLKCGLSPPRVARFQVHIRQSVAGIFWKVPYSERAEDAYGVGGSSVSVQRCRWNGMPAQPDSLPHRMLRGKK